MEKVNGRMDEEIEEMTKKRESVISDREKERKSD